jgi:MFS family permease
MTDVSATQVLGADEPPSSRHRLLNIRLSQGVGARHALLFLVVAISSIGLFVFLNFMQPYLLHGQIKAPAAVLGRLTSRLSIMQEVLVLVFVGPLGALCDRVGRPPVYAAGLVVLALGLGLYSVVTSVWGLYAARFVFACGLAGVSATLATVAADYPQNRDRGKFLGLLLVTQQLAILVLVANVAAKVPHWLTARGVDPIVAGQLTFRGAAAVGLIGAALAFFGLKHGASVQKRQAEANAGFPLVKFSDSLLQIVAQVRQEPRFMIVLAVAFVARGDAAIMTTFLSLWTLKIASATGLNAASGLAIAGRLLSAVTFCGIATALFIGWAADRLNRVGVLAVALAIAGVGNIALVTIRSFGDWPVYALVGLIAAAETAVIVCGQAVLGEQARPELRGAAVGAFSIFGSLGVLILVFCGGLLFDKVSGQAPFVMIGLVNFLASLAALYVVLRPNVFQSAKASAAKAAQPF